MYQNIINKLNNPDLIIRSINIKNKTINVLFFDTLVNTKNVNDFILIYLNYIKIKRKNINKYIKDIPNFKIEQVYIEEDIINNIFNGFVIINIDNNYYSIELKKQLDSGINESENEKILKGPKDAFTENYQTNIGLIRKRCRTPNLKIKEITIGNISKTKVGILYIDNICNLEIINKLVNKLNKINTDIILNHNFIYEYIFESKSLFKSVITTERPDMVSYKLLNGKVAIVIENTNEVILLPIFFSEFFHSMKDYYINNINATYIRIIRMIAFFITVMLPGIYIAIITYNQEIIPPSLLINFAMQKQGVPFPTFIEALLTNLIFEILRETDERTPSSLGSALSIVGALVLGDAAVNAGLVSPIMVIIIAITAISELIFSTNELDNACKIWRLIFIFFATTSGIIGIYIALFLLIAELESIKLFNYPYMYPASPINKTDMKDDIYLSYKYKLTLRNNLTALKNKIRGKL